MFEANPLDVEKAKDRERGGGRGRRERRSQGYTVQLRGLPYRASEREIAEWLSEAAEPDDVIITMDRSVFPWHSNMSSVDPIIPPQDQPPQWPGRGNLRLGQGRSEGRGGDAQERPRLQIHRVLL